MKSRKEIKDTTIKILRIVFSNSSRTIWIMALVGGFFAGNYTLIINKYKLINLIISIYKKIY